jgi:hypothetical protein
MDRDSIQMKLVATKNTSYQDGIYKLIFYGKDFSNSMFLCFEK